MTDTATSILKRSVHILVLVLFLLSVFKSSVSAQSAEQRRLFNSGILYYDREVGQYVCNLSGTGGEANINVALEFNLGSGPQERRVNLVKALIADFGLSPEQAAGIVGNFMHESGGTDLPPNVNEGGRSGPPAFSGGYGWAQWTGSRQTNFIDFAIENGYMESRSEHATDAANYAFLKYELSTGYTETIDELRQQFSPEDAALSFEETFERAGIVAPGSRTEKARQAFDEYLEGGGTGAGGSCPGSGAAAILGEYAFPLVTTKSGIGNPDIFQNGTTTIAEHPYTAYDILVDPGTPVVAFLSGEVVRISQDKCSGRLISIHNKESDLTISYLHLAFNESVAEGDTVSVGQQIGQVGSADEGCDVPHLHIDAASGDRRPGCTRENCPAANANKFEDIGPHLFETYEILVE